MRNPVATPVGRTRWRRFSILFVPSLLAAAVMVYLAASGALALNLAISGMPFKLSASNLSGNNFVQFAAPDAVTNPGAGSLIGALESANGIHPPGAPTQVNTLNGQTYSADTVTYLQAAQITNLHQTVCAPLAPTFLGFSIPALQVTIDAGGSGTPASAPALVVQAPAMNASSATFTNIVIGQDTSSALSQYGYPVPAHTGGLFSQAADHVSINGLNQIAVGTEAASFTLPNLTLDASFVNSCT